MRIRRCSVKLFRVDILLYIAACIDDIRLDRHWFPMTEEEEPDSPAATLERNINTKLECVRNDCQDQCTDPFVCVPLWEDYVCKYVHVVYLLYVENDMMAYCLTKPF